MIVNLLRTLLALLASFSSQPSDSGRTECLNGEFAIFRVIAPDDNEEEYPDDYFLPDCSAAWKVELVTDSSEIRKVCQALARLDTCHQIDTNRAALELFAEAYSESFLNQIRSAREDPGTWNLEKTDFDGIAPGDYYLYIYDDGSISRYEEMVIVRSENRITLQSLWGVGRGRNNVFARATQRNEAAAKEFFTGLGIWPSSITKHPVDFNHDGTFELFEFDMFTRDFEFAEIDFFYSCLPAIYSWNGRQFTCDTELNRDFKRQLRQRLHLLDPQDSAAIEWRIQYEAE